ncbi:MAG: M15 family metallopeptidase [Candidatus Aenigmarchaeota archaeon]|nr:M15 family metallopeptidase [Candidatus Aenigmarchaeota archaeon]
MAHLIPDKELAKVPLRDNGEKMVSVKDACPKIAIRLGHYIRKEGRKFCEDACLVRESVAEKLNLAQSLLPNGHRLLLRCGYRPLSIQIKRYNWMENKLKKKHPDWSKEKLKVETGKCVAPLDIVPPHSTGGAVDVSIIGPDGRRLDMGSQLGRFTEKTYTCSKKISTEGIKNRKILIRVMKKAGFVNYPTEYWHWSYGDQYWAAILKKKHSIYKGL